MRPGDGCSCGGREWIDGWVWGDKVSGVSLFGIQWVLGFLIWFDLDVVRWWLLSTLTWIPSSQLGHILIMIVGDSMFIYKAPISLNIILIGCKYSTIGSLTTQFLPKKPQVFSALSQERLKIPSTFEHSSIQHHITITESQIFTTVCVQKRKKAKFYTRRKFYDQ